MATDAYNPGPSLWTTHPKMIQATENRLRKLFAKSIGDVWVVPEVQFPRYIFLAGNAPALVLRIVDAFVKAADLGPKDRKIYHAILSALYHGVVLEHRSPSEVVSSIATKGGVTQAGLDVLEQRWHIDAIARETRDACLQRLQELSGPEKG
jgi:pyrroline-5-carboxylate reductase